MEIKTELVWDTLWQDTSRKDTILQVRELKATGFVKNTSDEIFFPEWKIEGDFYSDAAFTIKLGSDSDVFDHSLNPGEMTIFIIKFSSNYSNSSREYDLKKYPDFRVKNLRAVTPKLPG